MDKMLKIKAVLSDGGNILFSDEKVKRGLYEQVKDKIAGLTYKDFREGFQRCKVLAQTKPEYDIKDALKDYLQERRYIGEVVQQEDSSELELIKGVKETLMVFYERGVPFIILTDATKKGEQLRPFLSELGIDELVADIISSKDVGVVKPDPEFFNFALMKYGLKKKEVIFVAHDDDELRGVDRLGIKVYAFNYGEEQDLGWLPEEQKLKDFRELEKVVFYDE